MVTRSEQSTALAAYQHGTNAIEFMREAGRAFAAYIPGTTEDQGKAIALNCFAEGLTPEQFKRKYHWMPGVGSTPKAAAQMAEFRMNYGGDYIIKEHSPQAAEVEFIDAKGRSYVRRNDRMRMMLSRWPWAKRDEKAGKLGWQAANIRIYELIAAGRTEDEIFREMLPHFKDNWGTEEDWKNMLMSRLAHELVSICPELAAGVYTEEELGDIDDAEIVSKSTANATSAATTAAEILNANGDKSAEPPIANGQQAEPFVAAQPFVAAAGESAGASHDSDTVDAEFSPVESQVEPTESLGNGHATSAQIKRMLDLSEELQVPLGEALKRRGVNALHSLTCESAQEIIDKLESHKQSQAARGN